MTCGQRYSRNLKPKSNMTYKNRPLMVSTLASMVLGAMAVPGCHDNRIPLAQYIAQANLPPGAAEVSGTDAATSQPSAAGMQPWSPGPYQVGPGDVLSVLVSGLESLQL